MRVGRIAPWVIALVIASPSVAAQGTWTDPKGDHEVGFTAQSQFDDASYTWTKGEQTGWYPLADVTRAAIHEEADDTITFEFEVAERKAKGDEPHPVDHVQYMFDFGLHGQQREIRFFWNVKADSTFASLRTLEGRFGHTDESFPAELLPSGKGWKVVVPKERFRDGDLIPIRKGDVLEKVTFRDATGLWSTVSPCVMREDLKCWKARDAIGAGPLGDYSVQRSPAGVGHLELTSPAAMRSSNGLATTYVYELTLHNLDATPDQAFVKLGTPPPDWQVHAPTLVDVPAKSRTTFPVAVTVPFVHEHGRESFLNVTVESRGMPGTFALIEIGVVWTKIPQPAGHHPDVYLHAGENGDGWMNTLAEDPEATKGGEITFNSYSASFDVDSYSATIEYDVPLSPSLQMGLDFDTAQRIVADFNVKFPKKMNAAIAGMFLVEGPDGKTIDIGRGEVAARDYPDGGLAEVHMEIPVDAKADRLPHVEEWNLYFRAQVKGGGSRSPTDLVQDSGFEPPVLLTERGQFFLPLVEYLEVTDEALLSALTRFSLTAVTETVKSLNPGRVAAFAFKVHNNGESDEVVSWSAIGANTDWAEIFPPSVKVPRGGDATVLVAVTPPDDANEGEGAELLLLGQSGSDENAQVYVRLIAQVTKARDIPDETDLANELRGVASENQASSPSPLFVGAVVAVLAAVLWRRRVT